MLKCFSFQELNQIIPGDSGVKDGKTSKRAGSPKEKIP